jgi:hypothetical protein
MAGRLASLLPRFVALPLIAVLGTATITFAANRQLSAPQAPPQPAAAAVPSVLVVPDVRRQAFVFAKGTLEDAGFSWVVSGPVKGYAANNVASQSPLPGTRVVDTGSPIVQVTLTANASYGQTGSPEDAAPYGGTEIELAGGAPAAEQEPEALPEPQAKPKPQAKPEPKAKPKAKPAAARAPAFVVAGAPKEPLDEMPLTDRARLLGRYLAAHPKPTNASVGHFLYQHAWIVAGAKFGWSRGAEALELLIAVDRRAQRAWGVGAKSEATARAALARVRAASR